MCYIYSVELLKHTEMKTKFILLYQFAVGFLSVFGLASPINNMPKKSDQSCDTEKLCNDWLNVGSDINKSYEQFKSEPFQ